MPAPAEVRMNRRNVAAILKKLFPIFAYPHRLNMIIHKKNRPLCVQKDFDNSKKVFLKFSRLREKTYLCMININNMEKLKDEIRGI